MAIIRELFHWLWLNLRRKLVEQVSKLKVRKKISAYKRRKISIYSRNIKKWPFFGTSGRVLIGVKLHYLTQVKDKSKWALTFQNKSLFWTILIVTDYNSNFLLLQSSSISRWKNGLLVGYFGDLLKILEKSLNFTANFVREETDYGSLDVISGNWSEAMGLAVRKEVDLVAADFEMTSQRLEVIDFSTPLFFSRTVLYIRKPSTKLAVNWSAHFKVHISLFMIKL